MDNPLYVTVKSPSIDADSSGRVKISFDST